MHRFNLILLLAICLPAALSAAPATSPATSVAPLTESAKIKALLNAVTKSKVVFIRNGVEYSPSRTRNHMQLKLSRAGNRIKTAEHFITYLATKSSFTGRPYYVKLPEGKKILSSIWLKTQLKLILKKHQDAQKKLKAKRK